MKVLQAKSQVSHLVRRDSVSPGASSPKAESSSTDGLVDRMELASEILKNPESAKPPTESLLNQAFQAAKGVALDLVSSLLFVDIPEPAPDSISQKIGRAEVADAKAEFGTSDDPKLRNRLDTAVSLAQKALSPSMSLNEVVVLDTEELLGSCTPDGSILVSRGMIDSLNDKELLFVVGHEVGHLLREDDAQRLAFERDLSAHIGDDGEVDSLRGRLIERKMSQFFHRAELASDDYGVKALEANSQGREAGISYFYSRPEHGASNTHPADFSRIWRIADSQS